MPYTGLYMARECSGEGLAVHRDQHVTGELRYGYVALGEPTWLLAAAESNDGAWGQRFLAYSRPETELVAVPAEGFRADFHRGPYEVPCASADQSSLFPRGTWHAPGGDARGRCLQPLLL